MRRSLLASMVVCASAWGCTSTPSPPPPRADASAADASAADTSAADASAADARATAPGGTEIADAFHELEEKLPEPEPSEQNGAAIMCLGGRGATYTQLQGTASKVPAKRDSDLAHLVPWATHADPCIRHIAIRAMLGRVEYDANKLVAPYMHDPEHYIFRDILFTVKAHLDTRRIPYDAKIFDGFLLDVQDKGFAKIVHGSWVEEIDRKGFQIFLLVDGDQVRVTSKHVPGDPGWPDHTQTTKIKRVRTNDRGQFVLTGAWSVESNANGYQGPKNVPAQFVYSFWPVKPGLMWFKNGNSPYWIKMERGGP